MRRLTILIALAAALALPSLAITASAQEGVYQEASREAEQVGMDNEGLPEAEEGGTPNLWDVFRARNFEFWGPVINFLFVLLIITAFGGPPLKRYLVARRQEIAQGLEEASRLKAEAQAKYDEYTSRLQRLDEELERIRAEMVKAGEAERDRIVGEAEAKAARMRRDTQFVIEQQMKQLREDLTNEAVHAAIAAAEKVLAEKITSDDQQRLAKHYLAVVGQEVRASMEPPAPAPAASAPKAEEGRA